MTYLSVCCESALRKVVISSTYYEVGCGECNRKVGAYHLNEHSNQFVYVFLPGRVARFNQEAKAC